MRTRVFTVTPETWVEHKKAGVAGINDPAHSSDSPQAYATRQKVMTEVAGIRPGDRLFFYIQRTKEVIGGFEATTGPFYDPSPVYPGASQVDARFPFRVGFRQVSVYERPLHVNEIWAGRDAGLIWTMQQARGDAIGRHACWPLSKNEGDLLLHMLNELNVVIGIPGEPPLIPVNTDPLPIDTELKGIRYPHLKYEATLQSLILEDLADGKWKDLFGGYNDFLPFVPTSEGSEIDVILLKHGDKGEIIWYQILELKKDRYRADDLLQLLSYETWLTSNQAEGNPRAVHMLAVANRFDDDVLRQVAVRNRLKQKPVRLITYEYNRQTGCLQLSELARAD